MHHARYYVRFDPQTAHQPPEDEIQWILNECSKYLDDGMNVRRSDVLSAWRGWRPLASDPHAEPVPRRILSLSQRYLLIVSFCDFWRLRDVPQIGNMPDRFPIWGHGLI